MSNVLAHEELSLSSSVKVLGILRVSIPGKVQSFQVHITKKVWYSYIKRLKRVFIIIKTW